MLGIYDFMHSLKEPRRAPPTLPPGVTVIPFTEDFTCASKMCFEHKSLQAWVDETAAVLLPMLPKGKSITVGEGYDRMTLAWVDVPIYDLVPIRCHAGHGRSWGADGPVKLPVLRDCDQVWMSLSPMEVLTLRRHHKSLHRHCCIGGLGLGYSLERVLANPKVRHVTVVEMSQPLVDLLRPSIDQRHPGRVTFVVDDVWKHLSKDGAADPLDYDSIFIDVWPGFGGNTKRATFKDLRDACCRAPKRPYCCGWG